MARERPTASPASASTDLDGGAYGADMPRVARDEAHALPRSAPDTDERRAEHLEPLRASSREPRGAGEDQEAMAGACIHTVFRSATGNWANQVTSGERVFGVHATKEECVRRGQDLASALGVQHAIHDVDGTVSSLNTYRTDPDSP